MRPPRTSGTDRVSTPVTTMISIGPPVAAVPARRAVAVSAGMSVAVSVSVSVLVAVSVAALAWLAVGPAPGALAAEGAVLAQQAGPPAHAALIQTSPGDGAQLSQAPQRLRLRFNEPMRATGAGITANGTAGGRVDLPNPDASGNTISVPWPVSADTGRFRVEYRVVSRDGHVVTGQFGFAVDPEADSAAAASPSSPAPTPSPFGAPGSQAEGDDPPTVSSTSGSADGESGSPVPPWLLAAGAALAVTGVAVIAVRIRRGQR